ncbi:MAG: tRNA (adenosine(37)-N6)-dimethylallyltransferase MiaA [Candidatus Omnitrophica bacterium]|nr:tRNA (adenosine(37)-N6)-dimethylallyltransferase MiaA [Candidatus Omnitrophota bacterium]
MLPIIFILGPTATGKTDAAFNLARKIDAEIVSCDSMLVYKEPRIITTKPSCVYLDKIPHHFVDIISVEENYNVFTYFRDAVKLINELYSRGTPVIVCGGTGMYAQAILDGIFEGASRDDTLRAEFENEARVKGNIHIHAKLKSVDPVSACKISPNDAKRIIRALEVYALTGIPISQKQKEKEGIWGKLPVSVIGLSLEREALYERINRRVDMMVEQGAVDEVKELLTYRLSRTAEKIIGIKEIGEYLDNKCTLDEAKETMKKNTRNFAKRQMTWFKAESRLQWVDADGKSREQVIEDILSLVEAELGGKSRE